ncbi:MAG: rhodanese-like domain-containing protein [Balneolaceae bacterium]
MGIQTLVKEICPTSTREWIKKGALLIDVREKDEVEHLSFEVPQIINIPLSEFENRFNEIPKDKNAVIVCNTGDRSLRAAGFLVNHGYEKVVNMQYGMVRWAQKGFHTMGNSSEAIGINSCCSTIVCC